MAPTPLQRMLFSATLTSNPKKLAPLNLKNPRLFTLSGGEAQPQVLAVAAPAPGDELSLVELPRTLEECTTVVCVNATKPLMLLAILHRFLAADHQRVVLVFTSSVDSTHRLCRLLQLHAGLDETGWRVAEFARSLPDVQRQQLRDACARRAVHVLVCSDGMSRGIDLPAVDVVINYDTPSYPKTYVHRVGRTARAGRPGTALTLLQRGQERQFADMRKKIGSSVHQAAPQRYRVPQSECEALKEGYDRCLNKLRAVLLAESRRELQPTAPLDVHRHLFSVESARNASR